MALKTPYLAAENSAMERRARALHRFLVGSPIFLLIAVALVAHVPKPPYAHPAGDAEYDRKVLAYRERVVAAQAIDGRNSTTPTETIVREAQAWADGFASGALVSITAAVYEDHFRDGVRGEIFRAGLEIASSLGQRADDASKPEDKVRLALLSCEAALGLRDFDLQSHLQTMLLIRRNLNTVARLWPTLPPSAKATFRPRLEKLIVDRKEVDRLAQLERSQFEDYIRRQKLNPADLASDPRYTHDATQEEEGAAGRGTDASNARVKALLGS